jgi:protein SCO1/2
MNRPHAAAWLAAVTVLTGCAPRGDAAPGASGKYAGMVLTTPIDKPDFTFTATDGQPFALRQRTEGYVTLLFFGYTSCPDVCPVHMANLAEVLRGMPVEVTSRVKVVFVTTDPDRDSLPVIRRWLDAFDRSFIGVRASLADVNRVLESLKLPGAVVERLPQGGVSVSHPAAIVAFTRDNFARVYYPYGVRQRDWAHDLPLLVTDPGAGFEAGARVRVTRAILVAPVGTAPAALYATIVNDGDEADSLVGCSTLLAASCGLHESHQMGAQMMMRSLNALVVPAHGSVRLAPGGVHGMLEQITSRLPLDSTRIVTFQFARGGEVPAEARVVSYAELERVLALPEP